MGKLKNIKGKHILTIVAILVLGVIIFYGYQMQQMKIVEASTLIEGGKVRDLTNVHAEVVMAKPVNLIAPKDVRVEEMRIQQGYSMGLNLPVFRLSTPLTKEDYMISYDSKIENTNVEIDKLSYNLSKAALQLEDSRESLKDLENKLAEAKALYEAGQGTKGQIDSLNYQITKQKINIESQVMDYELQVKSNEAKLVNLEYDLKSLTLSRDNLDPESLILTDEDGIYYSKESFLCMYSVKQGTVKEGEILLTYLSNERKDEVTLRVKTDNDTIFEPEVDNKLRFQASDGTSISGHVKKVETYADYSLVTMKLSEEVLEQYLRRISLSGKVEQKKDTFFRVNKTSIIPITTMEKGEEAYLYRLHEVDGMFGKEYEIKKHIVTITNVGVDMVGINFAKEEALIEAMDTQEVVQVTKFPDASFYDGQRVRLQEVD